jgi:hypothetical protein
MHSWIVLWGLLLAGKLVNGAKTSAKASKVDAVTDTSVFEDGVSPSYLLLCSIMSFDSAKVTGLLTEHPELCDNLEKAAFTTFLTAYTYPSGIDIEVRKATFNALLPCLQSTKTFSAPADVVADGWCDDAVNLILESAVPIDKPNSKGTTALMSASAQGKLDLVKKLLGLGADARLKDESGNDALQYALYCKDHVSSLAVSKALLEVSELEQELRSNPVVYNAPLSWVGLANVITNKGGKVSYWEDAMREATIMKPRHRIVTLCALQILALLMVCIVTSFPIQRASDFVGSLSKEIFFGMSVNLNATSRIEGSACDFKVNLLLLFILYAFVKLEIVPTAYFLEMARFFKLI